MITGASRIVVQRRGGELSDLLGLDARTYRKARANASTTAPTTRGRRRVAGR